MHVGKDKVIVQLDTQGQFVPSHVKRIGVVLYPVVQVLEVGIGVAEHCGITFPTLLRTLDRLEEMGQGAGSVLQVAVHTARIIMYFLFLQC